MSKIRNNLILSLIFFSFILNTFSIFSITNSEVSAHSNPSDCWVIIDRGVYDVSSYINIHPGGVGSFTCGRDITLNMQRQGHPKSYTSFVISKGTLTTTNNNNNNNPTNNNNNPTNNNNNKNSYSYSTVSQHNTTSDCWITINNKVFDASGYSINVGRSVIGNEILKCGGDETQFFQDSSNTSISISNLQAVNVIFQGDLDLTSRQIPSSGQIYISSDYRFSYPFGNKNPTNNNFTKTQVLEHNSTNNCYIIIENKVYDVSLVRIISRFTNVYLSDLFGCGKDITNFLKYLGFISQKLSDFSSSLVLKGSTTSVTINPNSNSNSNHSPNSFFSATNTAINFTSLGDFNFTSSRINNNNSTQNPFPMPTSNGSSNLTVFIKDITIEKVSGEYFALISIENRDTANIKYTQLQIGILEINSANLPQAVRIGNRSNLFKYNLKSLVDIRNLKKGKTYQLGVLTPDDFKTKPFMFGGITFGSNNSGIILDDLEINGERVMSTETLQVLTGENLNIKIKFTAINNFENARFSAMINGYENGVLLESTNLLKLEAGKTYTKILNLKLPKDLKSLQDYSLRIFGASDISGLSFKSFNLYVDSRRHDIEIFDLVFTPSNSVETGQNIIANVRLKNFGKKFENDIKVAVRIPKLNISQEVFVTDLNHLNLVTSDDVVLAIPDNAKPGNYEVEVFVLFNNEYSRSLKKYEIEVINVKENLNKGFKINSENNINLESGIYKSFEVIVSNPKFEISPVSLVGNSVDLANFKISPSVAMIETGGSAVFRISVKPKDGVIGEKTIQIGIRKGGDLIDSFTVQSYIKTNESKSWVNFILIMLLILFLLFFVYMTLRIAGKRANLEIEEDESIKEISNKKKYY